MAVSVTKLPENQGHMSLNGVFRVGNDAFRLNSSSRIEIKFVDLTRFLTTFWSPEVAVSVTKLPKNQGHRSSNGVFRAANDIWKLSSSSPMEIKFVDFTRFLTVFWSPNVAVSVTKLLENQGHRP